MGLVPTGEVESNTGRETSFHHAEDEANTGNRLPCGAGTSDGVISSIFELFPCLLDLRHECSNCTPGKT